MDIVDILNAEGVTLHGMPAIVTSGYRGYWATVTTAVGERREASYPWYIAKKVMQENGGAFTHEHPTVKPG